LTPQWGFGDTILYAKAWSKTPTPNFWRLTTQKKPIFLCPSGDDGHGHGEGTFLVK
jgi:hypothetical protein